MREDRKKICFIRDNSITKAPDEGQCYRCSKRQIKLKKENEEEKKQNFKTKRMFQQTTCGIFTTSNIGEYDKEKMEKDRNITHTD